MDACACESACTHRTITSRSRRGEARQCLLVLAAVLMSGESGILKLGTPLHFSDSKPFLGYVRDHGVEQFLHKYTRARPVLSDELLWGDEIEYGIFHFNHTTGRYELSLRGPEIIRHLLKEENRHGFRRDGCNWQPEYGAWMVESTPNKPYRGYATDLLHLEENLRLRRKRLHSALHADEIAPSCSTFPLLGVQHVGGIYPGPIANSAYLPDDVINPHPRYGTLAQNIRARRGSNVNIWIPKLISSRESAQSHTSHIHMDAMAFGAGCCCTQVTIQAGCEKQSRYMYDQLAILSPLLMALSASTPIHKGELAGIDVRWDAISQSVDDRTLAERGLVTDEELESEAVDALAGRGINRLEKSRYSSISTYIGMCETPAHQTVMDDYLNDVTCETDSATFEKMLRAGVDKQLSRHIAHLFVRDPLVIFQGNVYIDDTKHDDHFQSIQSTNWRTVRWKIPDLVSDALASPGGAITIEQPESVSSNIPESQESSESCTSDLCHYMPSRPEVTAGWRTEFRAMEVQLTDFENAAYGVFLLLVSRALLAFGASLYLPLSMVDANMHRAHATNAVRNQKFYFREDVFDRSGNAFEGMLDCVAELDSQYNPPSKPVSCREMSLDEIVNGCPQFVGLVGLAEAYLDAVDCDMKTRARVSEYLTLIRKRASGALPTAAEWMRGFVTSHLLYRGDGQVTAQIATDLLNTCEAIGMGRKPCPELLGDVTVEPLDDSAAFDIPLSVVFTSDDCRRERLLERAQSLRANTKTSAPSRTAASSSYRSLANGTAIAQ